MPNPFRFFATGKDKPTLDDREKIDKLYKRSRLSIILVITIGYGFAFSGGLEAQSSLLF